MPVALVRPVGELAAAFRELKTTREIAELLEVKFSKLVFHLYKVPPAKKYATFVIPKKSGGLREISAPISPIKILQRKLSQILQAAYPIRPCVHGFARERSIVTNARNHVRKRWVLNVDLADFFPSINFGRVRGMFMAPPYKLPEPVSTVLAQLCCHDGKLPQGAPTSPVIANMICARLDNELRRLAGAARCAYSRYADDLTFSTTLARFPAALAIAEGGEFGVVVRPGAELRRIIHSNGFGINPDKVRLYSPRQRQEVTGLITNVHVNLPRKSVRQVRAMLHAWRKHGPEAADREFLAKYDRKHRAPRKDQLVFPQVVKGKIDFIGMVRGKADRVYRRLLHQYADLVPTFVVPDVTAWDKVERQLAAARRALSGASTSEDFQGVGHVCRELIITLAQTVYDVSRHRALPGTSPTHAKALFDAYFDGELSGDSAESSRRLCKATLDQANTLTHKRSATLTHAKACLIATEALIDQVANIESQREGVNGLTGRPTSESGPGRAAAQGSASA